MELKGENMKKENTAEKNTEPVSCVFTHHFFAEPSNALSNYSMSKK